MFARQIVLQEARVGEQVPDFAGFMPARSDDDLNLGQICIELDTLRTSQPRPRAQRKVSPDVNMGVL